jgi:hypothetical protein
MRPIRLSRRLLACIACALGAAVLAGTASAQEDTTTYPSKPIRIVVGFAAGGGNDLVARIVGPKLSEIVGQPVIVENRPGAAGQLAVTYVQSQPGDGYTIIVGAIGQLAIATAIYPNLPFHPTRTLVPLTLLGSYWLAIAGSMQHGIASLADLVAFAKANPAKSNYPSSSPAFTIPAELLKLRTGMPGQIIPYKSTNEMDAEHRRRADPVRLCRSSHRDPAGAGRQDPPACHDRTEPPARTARRAHRRRGGVRKYRRPAAVDRCIRHCRDAAGDRAKARGGDPPGSR